MPTYAKQQKGVQDYGAGFRDVNKSQSNQQALYDGWSAEHGDGTAPVTEWLGRHNSAFIARASMQLDWIQATPGITTPMLHWDALGDYVGRPVKIATGVVAIPIFNLEVFTAHTVPVGSISTVRFVHPALQPGAVEYPGGILLNTPSILFTCYQLSAGSFEVAEFNFTATLKGY